MLGHWRLIGIVRIAAVARRFQVKPNRFTRSVMPSLRRIAMSSMLYNATVSLKSRLVGGAARRCAMLGMLIAANVMYAGAGNNARAQTPRLFSPAWFAASSAQRGASPAPVTTPTAPAMLTPSSPVLQSIADFARAAQAIAHAQAAQSQASAVAAASAAAPGAAPGSSVPNGLVAGGLQPNLSNWTNAAPPSQSNAAGRTTVTVQQNQSQAFLTWNSFNVGRHTTLAFDQSAGGASANTWLVLNKVNDPSAAPSQILGSITAPGQVLVINPNGIIFGAGAQVNVGALLASTAALANSTFTGIYSQGGGQSGYLPSFTGATNGITVAPGAAIDTNLPPSATSRGGFVILLGSTVENDGSINTPSGQTVLAAGQSFILRPGFGTNTLPTSTTLGTEVAVTGGGAATNTGLIQASTGDITMVGETVTQAGVAYATTSVSQRGTIHLLTNTSDAASSVTLAQGSLTTILPDTSGATATDAQRGTLIGQSASPSAQAAETQQNGGLLNDQVLLPDRLDQSRVEITTGGTADFASGSLTMATGGQIAVSAVNRVFTAAGAVLDVGGSVGVALPASANTLAINVQGFQLRDSPANRDSGALASQTAFVNINDLTLIPAGTGGYPQDRYYTQGGLLEVGGELSNVGHTVQEWTTPGGTITLSSAQVVAQPTAAFNIAGGSVNYQPGMVKTTWLIGTNGQLYNVNTAPSDLTYTGLFSGFTVQHPRWGITQTFTNPLIAPAQVYQGGYTVGRDAGTLTISAPTAVFEATIDAGVVTGPVQSAARPTGAIEASLLLPDGSIDPFLLPNTTAPLAGSFVLTNLTTVGAVPFSTDVQIDDSVAPLAATLDPTTPLPAARQGTASLTAGLLNAAGLGGLTIDTTGAIDIDSPVTLADGAQVSLAAPSIDIAAALTARSGSVTLGNRLASVSGGFLAPSNGAGVTLESGGSIDTRGVFTNLLLTPEAAADQAFAAGGAVSIDTTQAVNLAAGSVIDASGGGTVLASGKTAGAAGGAISVIAYDPALSGVKVPAGEPFTIAGTLRSYGSTQGGALTIQVPNALISDAPGAGAAGQLVLPSSFFAGGFSSYTIASYDGISVAGNTAVQVIEPVYQFTAASLLTPTGSDPGAVFVLVLPPVYVANPATAQVVQRKGASLILLSAFNVGNLGAFGGPIDLGSGASIKADPGSSVRLEARGQLTVDGSITAPGGSISLVNDTRQIGLGNPASYQPGLSIWLGASSLLDVSAQAFTAADLDGRPFGVVPAGGTIQIGGAGGTDSNGNVISTDAYVIVRPGSVLDAAGTSAAINPAAGTGDAAAVQQVASNGGSIAFDSASGLYLAGRVVAPAGGAGAQGGTLSVALNTPLYIQPSGNGVTEPNRVVVPRELFIGPGPGITLPSGIQPGAALPNATIGQAYLTTSLLNGGSFGALALTSGDAIVFDGAVALTAGRSIALTAGVLGATGPGVTASVAAPYVTLSGGTQWSSTLPGTLLAQLSAEGGSAAWAPSTRMTNASLSVAATDIDVIGNISFGLDAKIPQFNGQGPSGLTNCTSLACIVDLAGFSQVTLASNADIRFLPGAVCGFTGCGKPYTTLTTPGDLTLVAGQIYPVTGADALITAGFDLSVSSGNPFLPTGVLSIQQAAAPLPAVPLTAGGILQLAAGTIDQGGVVRAPMGKITLGENGPVGGYGPQFVNGTTPYTYTLDLLPGSITSISAAGATIPYGGTSDGVTYTLNGGTLPLDGRSNINNVSNAPILQLTGQSITVASGATLDVSGGGTLAGAGFISGRGGSTDVLSYPLLALSTSATVSAPSAATNLLFAIIPGYSGAVQAPATATAFNGPLPQAGDAITLPPGVPGLPAGTYLLLPGSDALLPGAFRVQINTASHTWLGGSVAIGNGSYQVDGYRAVADTSFQAGVPDVVTVTPGSAVGSLAQYDQETYSQFELAQDALFGAPRVLTPIPEDAKTLLIQFPAVPNPNGPALTVQGDVNMQPASGGLGGTAEVTAATDIVVTPAGAGVPSPTAVSVPAAALNALGANTLSVGGYPSPSVTASSTINFLGTSEGGVTLQSGAILTAPQVFLVGGSDGVTIAPGAGINTLGRGVPSLNSSGGLLFNNDGTTVVAVSNGGLTFALAEGVSGPALLGVCPVAACSGTSPLYADGTITVVTTGSVTIGQAAQFGAQTLDLSVPSINIGTPASGQSVPPGLNLNQATLDALLSGNAAIGIPPLGQLTLAASQSINFYGSAALDSSGLTQLELDTPAIFGAGGPSDTATLTVGAGTLIWNGIAANGAALPAGPPLAGGPGTGTGTLAITAGKILLGYGPNEEAQNQISLGRLMLGFSDVTMTAGQSITAANRGSLAVYQSATGYQPVVGTTYAGGNLTLVTPLLTGGAGSVNSVTAGGALTITAPSGGPAATSTATTAGAEIDLAAATISNSTAIALPSGRLTMQSAGDILLQAGSYLDLAGRTPSLFGQALPSFGGAVVLQSASGNVTQAPGAVIDVSAAGNNAGSLSVTATGAGAGQVSLGGGILGGAGAGFTAGSFDLQAQSLDPAIGFSALNDALNAGGFFAARSFDIKTGNLVIGSNMRASTISVSVDGGSLQVAGTIDASGSAPGSITLAAASGLTLDSTAVLDAHGSVLQADSTGAPIDAENRATVALTVQQGMLTLNPGATIDVSSPDPAPQGNVAFNAPRTGETSGNVNIAASGPVTIKGAGTIAVNAFWTYTPTDPNGTIVQDNGGGLTGAPVATSGPDAGFVGLYQVNARSTAFMTAAGSNTTLQANLTGLTPYGSVFHLRPGVEIDSNGNLTISGDLDLSGYRYSDPSGYGAQIAAVGTSSSSITIGLGPNLYTLTTQPNLASFPLGEPITVTDSSNPAVTLQGTVASYNSSTGALGITATAALSEVGSTVGSWTISTTGSGEPGTLVLRAADNLNVYGSINDGFYLPSTSAYTSNPDNQGWVLTNGKAPTLDGSNLVLPEAVTLLTNTTNPTTYPNADVALNYSITVTQPSAVLAANATVPTTLTLFSAVTLPAGTVLRANITEPGGTVLQAGTTLGASTTLPAGSTLAPGTQLPVQLTFNAATTWPAGASLAAFAGSVKLGANTTLAAGDIIPGSATLTLGTASSVTGGATCTSASCNFRPSGQVWAVAPMLPAGSLSWSLDLAAGADLAASSPSILLSPVSLAATATVSNPTPGSIVLSDPHYQVINYPGQGLPTPHAPVPLQASWSVIRTGTGDLTLQAGGNLAEDSLYGIYTAGTQTTVSSAFNLPRATPLGCTAQSGANCSPLGSSPSNPAYNTALAAYDALVTNGNYQAYYPIGGGNVLITAQGDLTGDIDVGQGPEGGGAPTALDAVGNWLWRQGGVNGQPVAWWINFGTYVLPEEVNFGVAQEVPVLAGFVGIGALGGGNVAIAAGGAAGVTTPSTAASLYAASQGLDVAVATTGRVSGGTTELTGGGNISIQIAGALNGASAVQGELNGTVTDLRGQVSVQAGSIGQVDLVYGQANPGDPRSVSPLDAVQANSVGGLILVPGDASIDMQTRGDLVLGGVGDATRLEQENLTQIGFAFSSSTSTNILQRTTTTATTTITSLANTWFSLWQPDTSITLNSAGGNATPSTQSIAVEANSSAFNANSVLSTDGRFLYPPILTVEAPDGSIYAGAAGSNPASIELAPSPLGQLELLAGGSIFGDQYASSGAHGVPATFDISGASAGAMPTPADPAYSTDVLTVAEQTITKKGSRAPPISTVSATSSTTTNIDTVGNTEVPPYAGNLFAFAADTATGSLHAGDPTPALVYAGGDIVALNLGETLTFATGSGVTPATWYIAGKAVQMLAGGDIVATGTAPGATNPAPTGTSTGDLFLNANASDVSAIQAGGDIIYANAAIAGPGQLWVQAGGNVYEAAQGEIKSLGANPNAPTGSNGAAITVLAGAGATGPDWTDFANLYLNPANVAAAGTPVGADTGVVAQSYASQLLSFVQQNYGYQGSAAGALAFFQALPLDQRRQFLLGIYFDELNQSGLEFNATTSVRYKSYARGEEAIAALFPVPANAASPYQGDLTLFGNSGIQTLLGGGITLLTPGGNVILGTVTGTKPAASAGVLTEGGGDIDVYAWGKSQSTGTQGIVLGQSRAFTILGGNIVMWAQNGDINAGQGANTTSVATPVNIAYDADGNIFLSPSTAVTGAGIATLAPLAGTTPGNLNLVAVNGTINAGEAGIRASGNANLSALTVVNAANIQVTGKTTGVPTVVAPDVGAISAASATAAAAAQSAQQMAQASTAPSASQTPSSITVEVTGFGNQ